MSGEGLRERVGEETERAYEWVKDPDRWADLEADRQKGGFVGMQAELTKFVIEFGLVFWFLAVPAAIMGQHPDVTTAFTPLWASVYAWWCSVALGVTAIVYCGTAPD